MSKHLRQLQSQMQNVITVLCAWYCYDDLGFADLFRIILLSNSNNHKKKKTISWNIIRRAPTQQILLIQISKLIKKIFRVGYRWLLFEKFMKNDVRRLTTIPFLHFHVHQTSQWFCVFLSLWISEFKLHQNALT